MKSREVPRKVLESPLPQLGIMTMTALVHTAWKDHREKTHRSVKMGKTLEAAVIPRSAVGRRRVVLW